MKTTPTSLILSFLIIVSISFNSCSKKNCCVIPETKNTIFATKNNMNWQAPSQILKATDGTDNVNLTGHVNEETLNIILKKSNNTYTLVDAVYYTTVGQDAISSQYTLDQSQANALTIAANTAQLLEGTFTLYFKPVSGSLTSYPGTISFKNGIFRASW